MKNKSEIRNSKFEKYLNPKFKTVWNLKFGIFSDFVLRASNFRKSRGFTFIELMTVIAIIAILTAIVLPNLNSARIKGRDAKRISDLKSIQLALTIYYDTHRSTGYPTTLGALVTAGYLPVLPKDPVGSGVDYAYAALGSGTFCSSYHLGATLEGSKAQDGDMNNTGGVTACTGGGTDFNGTAAKCVSAHTGVQCYDLKP